MALDRTNLGSGQASGAPRIFTYITGVDSKATVIADDYFAGATNQFTVGDFILATCSDGSVLVVVTKSDSDEVDVAYVAVA